MQEDKGAPRGATAKGAAPAQHLDIDRILPPPRTFSLAGKTVDVSRIPTRVVLSIARDNEVLEARNDASFDLMLGYVETICKASAPEVTRDWLLDNTDITQLWALINFVLAPLHERVERAKAAEGADSKNA